MSFVCTVLPKTQDSWVLMSTSGLQVTEEGKLRLNGTIRKWEILRTALIFSSQQHGISKEVKTGKDKGHNYLMK